MVRGRSDSAQKPQDQDDEEDDPEDWLEEPQSQRAEDEVEYLQGQPEYHEDQGDPDQCIGIDCSAAHDLVYGYIPNKTEGHGCGG